MGRTRWAQRVRAERGQVVWETSLARARGPSSWWLAGAALLALALLALAGCGLPPDVVAEVEQQRDACRALERAADASPREQATGQAVGDVLDQLLYRTGAQDDVPPEVRARREARKPAEAPR